MAKGFKLFELFGTIGLDGADKSNQELDKMDSKASKVGDKFKKFGKGVAKAGKVIGIGAGIAGTAIMAMANKTAATTDRIDKLSQRLGMSRTGFQEWEFVLSQSGVDIDSLQSGMKTLSQRLDETAQGVGMGAELFERLGVTITDSMTQEEAFEATVAGLQAMEDGTEKAALAQQLLGRSGQELLPLLNSTAESTQEMKNKASELGLVMSDEAVTAGVNFTDTLDQLKRTLSAAFATTMAAVLPIIQDFMVVLMDVLPPILQLVSGLAKKLVPVIAKLIEKLLPVFIKLIDAIMPVVDVLIDIFMILVEDALLPIIDALLPLVLEILPIFTTILKALMPVLEPIIKILIKLIEFVLPFVIKYIQFLAENVIPIFIKALSFLPKIFNNISDIFTDVFGSMVKGFKWFVNIIIKGVNTLIRGINKLNIKIPKWLGGGEIGFNIREIPLLAEGGEIEKSGMAIVGEAGAELVNMKAGATVTPLNEDNMLGGGGDIFIEKNQFIIREDADIEKVARELNQLIIRERRGLGKVAFGT
jgi:phage-related protein